MIQCSGITADGRRCEHACYSCKTVWLCVHHEDDGKMCQLEKQIEVYSAICDSPLDNNDILQTLKKRLSGLRLLVLTIATCDSVGQVRQIIECKVGLLHAKINIIKELGNDFEHGYTFIESSHYTKMMKIIDTADIPEENKVIAKMAVHQIFEVSSYIGRIYHSDNMQNVKMIAREYFPFNKKFTDIFGREIRCGEFVVHPDVIKVRDVVVNNIFEVECVISEFDELAYFI